MLNSNYKTKANEDPTESLKNKLLKPKISVEPETTSEIDAIFNRNDTPKTTDSSIAKQGAKITGGDYGAVTTASAIKPSVLKEGESSGKWGEGSAGSKAASAGLGALDMASTVASKKGPMNRQERTANTLDLTAKGAQAGMAFGPWGAAIGAGVGAGTGLVMGIGDQKELDDAAKKEKIAMLDGASADRMKAQKMSDGKKVLSKEKALLEAQTGMLNSKYSQTKDV